MSNEQSRIQGYAAADILIKEMLDDAKEKLEPYAKREGKKLDWWKGFREGLLSAHCMMVLGQFPDQPDNAKSIDDAIGKYKKRREKLIRT